MKPVIGRTEGMNNEKINLMLVALALLGAALADSQECYDAFTSEDPGDEPVPVHPHRIGKIEKVQGVSWHPHMQGFQPGVTTHFIQVVPTGGFVGPEVPDGGWCEMWRPVRGWLEPDVWIQRDWRAFSDAKLPQDLQALLGDCWRGRSLFRFVA